MSETDSDMVEEFLTFFLLEDKFKSRERAVRIQGYAEEVVPNYSLSTFREHFRLTPETFEELVCELGNCPEIPLGHSHGGRPPNFHRQAVAYFLVVLRDTRMRQINFRQIQCYEKFSACILPTCM